MKIIFFGSSDFSIPVLKTLLSSSHSVVHVVTTPDTKKGRGQKLASSIVKTFALEERIPVSAPEKLSVPHVVEPIKALQPDFLAIASYGKMVPSSIFTIPKHAALNVHPSLLPRHRGASPIQSAILQGDRETGVSIAEVIKALDAGDVFGQIKTQIGENENAFELSKRLAQMGGTLLLEVISEFEKGKVRRMKQDESKMTYAQKLERDSGRINWNTPAIDIHNHVRAYCPWPSAFTFFHGKRLKILKAQVSNIRSTPNIAGTIVHIDPKGSVHVQTTLGTLELIHVQLEGRRDMTAFEFVLGQRIRTGDQFES